MVSPTRTDAAPPDRPLTSDEFNAAVTKALKLKETEEKLKNDGVAPAGGTPKQFGDTIKREIDSWAKVVKAADIKAD